MAKACLYARFSPRPNAGACESIEAQLDRCRAYCKAHDYEVAGEFHDADMSGGRADNRPGLQSAIEAACKHKAVLVTYSLSRFARNVDDTRALVDRLHKAGADFASVTEGISTRGAIGRAFLTLLAVFAELEREQIRERTQQAMLFHQKNGRRMGRADRIPYGKMADPQDQARMLPCVEELEVLAAIQGWRNEGHGYRAITAILRERGITCRGNKWHVGTIAKICKRVG